jgi:ATP-dependent helicase HrpB
MPSLPIDSFLPEITQAVMQSGRVILSAEPGAGKTTRLPAHLLKSISGRIAVLEPRRVAAISASQFVAQENGWKLGEEVGYQVRHDSKAGPKTRLTYMTDALFLRRMLSDPELNDFDLVILDEFHERYLDQDVALGLIKELQDMGREIKLLVMSATLEHSSLQNFLPGSLRFDIPGKSFPLEIRHSKQALSVQADSSFVQRVVDYVKEAVREQAQDILVFLPGVGEIKKVHTQLLNQISGRDILALHGSLPLAEQRKILSPSDSQRVILSTNIAEASVTVPGVNWVIDSGLVKSLSLNVHSGFTRLALTGIGRFNAKQRAGRAARQSPGICQRMWTSFEESSQVESLPAECERLDLSSTILLLSSMGVSQWSQFSWLTPPPHVLIKKASEYLTQLGALDEAGRLTSLGKSLLKYPLEPRWAALMVASLGSDFMNEAALSVALLSEHSSMDGPFGSYSVNDECDLESRRQHFLELKKSKNQSNSKLLPSIDKTYQELKRLNQKSLSNPSLPVKRDSFSVKNDSLSVTGNSLSVNSDTPSVDGDTPFVDGDTPSVKSDFSSARSGLSSMKADSNDIISDFSQALLVTQWDRLCRRRGQSSRGVMVGGRGVKLSPQSLVKKAPFFLCLEGRDIPGQPETEVLMASPVSKAMIEQVFAKQIKVHKDHFFDEDKGEFYCREQKRFYDLPMGEPQLSKISTEDLEPALCDLLKERWSWFVDQHMDLKKWMERWQYFVKQNPKDLNLSEAQIHQAIESACYQKQSLSEVIESNFISYVEMTVDPQVLKLFHAQVPSHFLAPSKRSHPIVYSSTEPPFVEVRMQELFSLNTHPRIGAQNEPLIIKILAPNRRPVQVSADIVSFWQGSYQEVRKEMRGRYPKHSWPEDPMSAQPLLGTKRSQSIK